MDKIRPEMYISISDKWHGTSAVFANILVKRELNWLSRLAKWLGVAISESEYGFTWSSRRVVKGVAGEAKVNSVHYYNTDIWSVVGREIEYSVPKGYTVYGEIVGWTPDGAPIQPGYHYGCEIGRHQFLVYRVTNTNPDGNVLELSWKQMADFCVNNGLDMVKEYFHGKAEEYCPGVVDTSERMYEWQERLLAKLEAEYVTDRKCSYNNNEVPAEGVVVKIDRLDRGESYKCKSFEFLSWETKQLDAGTENIEDNA